MPCVFLEIELSFQVPAYMSEQSLFARLELRRRIPTTTPAKINLYSFDTRLGPEGIRTSGGRHQTHFYSYKFSYFTL